MDYDVRHNKFKLSVPYENRVQRVVLVLMLISLPIWAVFLPYKVAVEPPDPFLYIAPGESEWRYSHDGPAVFVPDDRQRIVFFAAIVACAFLLGVSWSRHIVLTEKGIRFPPWLARNLHGRIFRRWKHLKAVQIICDGKLHCDPRHIVFRFEGSGSVKMPFHSVPRNQLQKLFTAVQTCAPHIEMDAHEKEVHARFIGDDIVLHPFTYARVWQDELSRRFNATAFVPLESGHKLQEGRYTIEGQLAFGGLSAIYVARQVRAERVVIKEAVVPEDTESETAEKAKELFRREAELLERLDHPNIARVRDHFIEHGRNYLVLDYIRGKDIRQLVANCGPQREDTVRRWAREIAAILAYLHELDPPVIHRDLSPDNLVLENDGSITLIDFGAANLFLGTATGTMIGKQSYMAPEQVRGKACPASDFYSLGATLYFCLTGKDPDPLTQSRPSSQGVHISEQLDDLIFALTALTTAERPGSAEEILALLAGAAATKLQAAPPEDCNEQDRSDRPFVLHPGDCEPARRELMTSASKNTPDPLTVDRELQGMPSDPHESSEAIQGIGAEPGGSIILTEEAERERLSLLKSDG